ncbi:LrgB family protein [Paracidovorax valerianellae]|uniref:TIGR00659 family protein n=1 Tax=Paracidovorax valerianellae TaxID=187868 RepID=A0A1G6WY11_9BURK|nr:LrgB family protein [Paracidovorax valerianellae]MDA8447680.1 LrgB family protein [Paracidovorax valerianellae]SDD70751.1 TIGR00659 family protein [Paracidovorax valerianellae]
MTDPITAVTAASGLAALGALQRSPLPWLALTLLAYLAALWLYRRSGNNPFLLPVLTAVVGIVCVLLVLGVPYPVYFEGVQLIHFFVGPATVALAVPLYSQLGKIRQIWRPVAIALLAGSVAAIASAVLVAWALGGSLQTLMSLAPKSATIPIATAVAERLGGIASLAAVAVAITGIAGAVIAGPLLRLLRLNDDPVVRGFAVGLTAHAIGTARELQANPTAGSFAALAMALNGIATALLMPAVAALLHWAGVW